MAKKDVAQIVRQLKAAGYIVELGGSGHYKVTHALMPGKSLSLGTSPSDFRWKQNFIGELRRGGWPLPIELMPVKKKEKVGAIGGRGSRPGGGANPSPPPPPATPSGSSAGQSGRGPIRRAPLTQRIAIPEDIITATITKEEVVTQPQQEAPKAAFEMYVPPARKPKPPSVGREAYITLRKKTNTIYLSSEAVKKLGHPERVNISVNMQACEMMMWADSVGHLWVTYPLVKTHKSGSIGATDLIRHFDLPVGTRWVEVPEASAPGRLLLRWQEEEV